MDKENVIEGLELLEILLDKLMPGCSKFVREAIVFLKKQQEEIENLKQICKKEQKAVKPVRDGQTGRLWLCGNCGAYVGFEDNDPCDSNEFENYCSKCGRPVLWEGWRSRK